MVIDLDQGDLKQGLLALVMALVEIIRDTLKAQALNRMESRNLTDEECERLGKRLMELDAAIEQLKEEQGIKEPVKKLRDALDDIVASAVDKLIDPASLFEKGNEQEGLDKDEHRVLVRN
jgi:hypothetical protein